MQPSALDALARQHLKIATDATSGRSAHTLYGGSGHVLRQTLIALVRGQLLHEHENPGEATLQVLVGKVRLASADASWRGTAGDLMIIPHSRHSLEALEDSVVLLTVGKHE